MQITKDTQSEIVIKMPWWFRVIAWSCVLFLLPIGIWMVGMTTKVIFNRPPGYMTVTRGHIPVFLWFLRRRVISREEAKSVFACVINNWWDEGSHHEVRVVANSGKEAKLLDGGRYGDVANYLAKRILDFAQEAEVELSPGAKFSMRVDEAFQAVFITGALGMVVGGRVEQGTITNGEDVEIRGRGRRKKAKVFEVDTLEGSGVQGERVRLLMEDLTEDDVKWGEIVERV